MNLSPAEDKTGVGSERVTDFEDEMEWEQAELLASRKEGPGEPLP